MAAGLIVLVLKYGFGDLLGPHEVVLDPSRVAAQIVSGIGCIGGGLIFVHRDAVRGLTTAAIVWLTAAIYGHASLARRILQAHATWYGQYLGQGAFEEIMQSCTGR